MCVCMRAPKRASERRNEVMARTGHLHGGVGAGNLFRLKGCIGSPSRGMGGGGGGGVVGWVYESLSPPTYRWKVNLSPGMTIPRVDVSNSDGCFFFIKLSIGS